MEVLNSFSFAEGAKCFLTKGNNGTVTLVKLERHSNLVLLLLSTAATGLSACSAITASSNTGVKVTPSPSLVANIVITPSNGSANVPLNSPVTVQAINGIIESVVVHQAGDTTATLAGQVVGQHLWKATDSLDPGTGYVISTTAKATNGNVTTTTAQFSTINVNRLTTATTPSDGETVGVGMPIKLRFNGDIPDAQQIDLLSHIQVQSVPPVPVNGAWHWFTRNEVHWRPENYWPSGTKVTVTGNLKGYKVSDTLWGLGNWSTSFTVGAKHVTTIDNNTHMMTVTSNDQPVYSFPVSLGKPSSPTISGTLVVWYRQQDVLMDSLSIGIPRNAPGGYYEHVFWDTAVSTDGFFIHAAPWSVGQQGFSNVSHGCVNLSTGNATTFYNFSQVGDVVQINNTGRNADASDGEGDWQIPFSKYANSGAQTPGTATSHPGGGL